MHLAAEPGIAPDANAPRTLPLLDSVSTLLPGGPTRRAPSTLPPRENEGPAVVPAGMTTRALYVAPQNADEAARAARAARQRGFNRLWVPAGETPDAAALLAAIQAGKENDLPVFAVVRVLPRANVASRARPAGAPRAATGNENADINILGETIRDYAARRLRAKLAPKDPQLPALLARYSEDWRRPDLPATQTELSGRLVAVAATPGLAGLVLDDIAAPGYADPGDERTLDVEGGAWDLGYTPALRLAFLRREGIDPVDVPPLDYKNHNLYRSDLSLPFFPGGGFEKRRAGGGEIAPDPGQRRPLGRWKSLRYETNVRLLSALFAAVRAARPDLPLLVRSRSDSYENDFGSWFALWDKPDVLPRRTYAAQGKDAAREAKAQGGRVLLSLAYDGRADPAPGPGDWPGRLAHRLEGFLEAMGGGWDGLVLDLRKAPVGKALASPGALAPAQQGPGRVPAPQSRLR